MVMWMAREAKIGLLVSVAVALILAPLWYFVLSPALAAARTPNSEEVVRSFEAEGLEVGTYYAIDAELEKEEDSPVPRTYRDATRFTIPSLEDLERAEIPTPLGPDGSPVPEFEIPEFPDSGDAGGRVFTFENQDDLEAVRRYYEGLPRILGFLDSHLYVEGNVLLQINSDLPQEQADEYAATLREAA